MLAYQSGIAKFNGMDVQVLAISTDFTATLKHWKENELKAEFPMLSDHMRKVAEQYGILIAQMGLANRATFIVDVDGNNPSQLIPGQRARSFHPDWSPDGKRVVFVSNRDVAN